jgi:transposase
VQSVAVFEPRGNKVRPRQLAWQTKAMDCLAELELGHLTGCKGHHALSRPRQVGDDEANERAEIILLRADGMTQGQIATRFGVSRVTVNQWCGRFSVQRVAGLDDDPGRGRKPWLPPAAVRIVLEKAVTPPATLGRWSCRTMAREAGSRKRACSACGRQTTSSRISRGTVRNFVRRLGMIGGKEPNDAATQRPSHTRRCPRPVAGWRRPEDGFRP